MGNALTAYVRRLPLAVTEKTCQYRYRMMGMALIPSWTMVTLGLDHHTQSCLGIPGSLPSWIDHS
jgi:hypothetical protein